MLSSDALYQPHEELSYRTIDHAEFQRESNMTTAAIIVSMYL